MSRLALVAAATVAVASLGASPLRAQRPADPDPGGTALLVRAESLSRIRASLDSVRRREFFARRRAQVLRAGRLTVVLFESISPELGQRIIGRADSVLETFGGGLAEWLDHVVAVQVNVSDAARILATPALSHRTAVELDWMRPALVDILEAHVHSTTAEGDTVGGAYQVASEIERRYRGTLDSAWQAWLPGGFVVWRPKIEGEWALRSLTEPVVTSGAGCLTGRVSECRLWLALDRTDRPVATRYRVADLRAQVRRSTWLRRTVPDRDACLGGDDAACVRFAESYPVVNPMPAPEFARASMVRAIWALHGPATVTRAFADTAGSVGERFARAAGIGEDSLVSEWRMWTLARGRMDRLAMTLPQFMAVIFAALLVVFLAARSGRWR